MNKFKKLIVPMTAFACALAMFVAVPFASANGWQYVGEETVYKYGDNWDSGGGYWKVSSSSYNTACVKYELWEYDPYDVNDYIGTRSVCPGGYDTFNVSGFTDGGGQAELIVKKLNYTNTPTRLIYHD
ncbi:hypothetical protein [Salinithrix halophila]|uniref:Uncharacterized protein n=1 Tax=Salinithrix halophila TaxID=1485204 RepID=A0ABV8JJK1_9BACL